MVVRKTYLDPWPGSKAEWSRSDCATVSGRQEPAAVRGGDWGCEKSDENAYDLNRRIRIDTGNNPWEIY